MNNDQELKLQAYLDNELVPGEAREVADWLARDRGAMDLLRTLRGTRDALAEFETGIRLPESREFYWSKIRRQIEQSETRPEPLPVPFLVRVRRFLIPASAVAVLVIAGLFLSRDPKPAQSTRVARIASAAMETALVDSKAFTYHDYATGATLVWLSYPADRDGGEQRNTEGIY